MAADGKDGRYICPFFHKIYKGVFYRGTDMLNYLWAGMIIVGIVYAACTGNIVEVTNAALDSSKEAITLCITMAGVMAFWTGLMEIARRGGMVRALTGRMAPVLKFLFRDCRPGIRRGSISPPISSPMCWGLAGRPRRPDFVPWRSWESWRRTGGRAGHQALQGNGGLPAMRCAPSLS